MAKASQNDQTYTRLLDSTEKIYDRTGTAEPQEHARSATLWMPDNARDGPDDVLPSRSRALSGKDDQQPIRVNRCRRFARCITSTQCRVITVIIFMVSVAVYCFVSFALLPKIFKGIQDSVTLRPNGPDAWKRPKGDIFLKVHFFNLTNPKEALNEGKQFMLQETGPYVYRIGINKINVVWNANSTVSYRERLLFNFEPSLSHGNQENVMQTVDVPFLNLASRPRSGKAQSWITKMLQSGDQLFTSRNVQELLWGYQDNALHKVGLLKSLDVLNIFKDLQDKPSSFGFMMTANSTPTPVYNVYTGETNFSKLNEVYSFGYQRFVKDSVKDHNYEVHGSATGALFPPPVDKKSSLALFFGPLLKSLELEFNQASSYKELDTLGFKVPNSQFSLPLVASSTPAPSQVSLLHPMSPHQKTIKTQIPTSLSGKPTDKPTTNDTSESPKTLKYSKKFQPTLMKDREFMRNPKNVNYLKGIASLEPLSEGAPLFVSFPHFLGADQKLYRKVHGLHPREHTHRSYVDIHPITGVTSHLRLRYQINARLNLKNLSMNPNRTSSVYLPLLWIETSASLDDESLDKLLDATFLIKTVNYASIFSLFFLCGFTTLLLILLVVGLVQHATDKHSSFIPT